MHKNQNAVTPLPKFTLQIREERITFELLHAFEDNVFFWIFHDLQTHDAGPFQLPYLMDIGDGHLTEAQLYLCAVLRAVSRPGFGVRLVEFLDTHDSRLNRQRD